MKRRRQRETSWVDDLVKAMALLGILASLSIWRWWNELTIEIQTVLLILIGFTALCGIGMVIAVAAYRRRQRLLAWRRAIVELQRTRQMTEWQRVKGEFVAHEAIGKFQRGQPDRAEEYHLRSAKNLSPGALEEFAAQVFEQMGYQAQIVGGSGDHGLDVRLVNPMGQVEIVQCKQRGQPVGEADVRNLLGAMSHERAVRGYLWAPNGFTATAQRWARGTPILLADDKAIGRMVEVAYRGREMDLKT